MRSSYSAMRDYFKLAGRMGTRLTTHQFGDQQKNSMNDRRIDAGLIETLMLVDGLLPGQSMFVAHCKLLVEQVNF